MRLRLFLVLFGVVLAGTVTLARFGGTGDGTFALPAGLCLLAAAVGPLAQAVGTAPVEAPGTDWQRVGFPDGSGSIALPPGWRLNSAQSGSAELQGPNGEAIAVGITMPVGPPQFAMPGTLAASYMLPHDAYAMVSEFTASRSGQSAQVRLVEVRPTFPLTQNGYAAYLLADQITLGKHYRSFALVNTADLGNGYWQFYMTLLTAPFDIFPKALPVMVTVWQSWGISLGEMNRRGAEALLTMRETHKIMQSTAEGRRTTEWHLKLTGMNLQGRWEIQNTATGERREVTMEQLVAVFEAEPARWRTLSAAEIGR